MSSAAVSSTDAAALSAAGVAGGRVFDGPVFRHAARRFNGQFIAHRAAEYGNIEYRQKGEEPFH
ncbi:hypothetical protein NX88_10500 [Neisseria meningitidis]|nr:hypothetical protein NX88_10500 [Neisseria meningitidis]